VGDLFEHSIQLGTEALLLAVLLSLPPLAASFLVSSFVGAVQSLTGVQDSTVGTLPRLVAVAGTLVLTLAWMGDHVQALALRAFGGS